MFNIFKTPTIVQELEQAIIAQQRKVIQNAIELAKLESIHASSEAHLLQLEKQLAKYQTRLNLASSQQRNPLPDSGRDTIRHLGA